MSSSVLLPSLLSHSLRFVTYACRGDGRCGRKQYGSSGHTSRYVQLILCACGWAKVCAISAARVSVLPFAPPVSLPLTILVCTHTHTLISTLHYTCDETTGFQDSKIVLTLILSLSLPRPLALAPTCTSLCSSLSLQSVLAAVVRRMPS